MTFDKNWETKIYKQGKQINQYPYDLVVSFVNRYFKKNILKKQKKKVLDLGCGTGNNLKFLCEFGFNKIYGIEGSKVAVKIAKKFLKKNKNCKIILGDFKKLKILNNSIDLCIDRGSITHNDINSIRNHYLGKRVLRPGGLFLSVIFSQAHSSYKKSKNLKTTLCHSLKKQVSKMG